MKVPRKRLVSIASANRWIGLALFVWLLVFPKPYVLAIAVALILPWIAVALVLRFPKTLLIDFKGRTLRGSLDGIFLIPSVALAVRAFRDLSFLDSWTVFLAAIATAACIIIVLTRILPRLPSSWDEWTVLALVALAYAFGALAQIDTLPDDTRPVIYRTTVRGMHVSGGRSSISYLDLAPWGQQERSGDVGVPYEFYWKVRPGAQVCVFVRPGFIGLRWYWVDFC